MSSSLGTTINLLRHGFGPIPGKAFAMRISGNGPFLVELRPFQHINERKGSHGSRVLFRAWWERGICSCERQQFINSIKPMRGIVKVKRPIEFYIDDNGELTKEPI
jgi:hypothetical protein